MVVCSQCRDLRNEIQQENGHDMQENGQKESGKQRPEGRNEGEGRRTNGEERMEMAKSE